MCVYVYVCGGRERERGRSGLNFCNAELSPKTGRPAAPGDEWENRSTQGKSPINRTQRGKEKKKTMSVQLGQTRGHGSVCRVHSPQCMYVCLCVYTEIFLFLSVINVLLVCLF